jgi:hypothetical protein
LNDKQVFPLARLDFQAVQNKKTRRTVADAAGSLQR